MSEPWNHDVIVIGGGPAGSTVARYAAANGADVLVIDGRDPIGTPLQCGELVPSNDEMRRLCPNVPEMDDLFQTPEAAISRRSTKMHIVPPSGKALKFDFEGLALNRVAHDEALVDLAKENGAKYLVDSHVTKVEENTVFLRNGSTYTSKIIVGAGGHNDPLRRDYWDESSLKIPVKFVLMDGNFGDAVELHFGSMAPGGYAWMFPKSSGANIGLGIQRSFAKGRSLNEYTEEFISKYGGEITFKGAGSLPMSGTIDTFVKGNYMLVGDAAGMVLPSNGAGITIAMVGGRIAGQVIAEHLTDGTPLQEFENRWKKQMGGVMRNSKRAFKIGSLLFRMPNWVLNLMFNFMTRGIIWRAVTCRRMFWLI
ncbi:MAG: NAD(P)/FAD-dependent oxidoreductase [Candidatus Thalassarchaeaceae archaeon]|nr:NAD(P)/FAD-dependent oxidoreductase [Candidatus Thalassarchaeaceae archaeon]